MQKLANRSVVDGWGDSLRVSVSLGVAHARAGDAVKSLLERAEQALCTARNSGKKMDSTGESH